MEQKYKYTNEMREMRNASKVVLSNRKTGNWLCISEETKEYVDELIYKKMSIEDFYNCFLEEDKTFMKKVIGNLIDMQLICRIDTMPIYDYRLDFTFSVTKRCNLQCKHCSYVAIDSKANIDELCFDEIINVLDVVIKQNPTSITITGGEPMVRKDFYDICDYLNEKYNGKKILMTNGTLISENNIECIIKTFDSIDISIDGINEETCSQIRGRGVYEKVINSIMLLHEKEYYNIALSMVVVGRNEHLVGEFKNMCEELKVRAIPRAFIIKGRGKENEYYLNESNVGVSFIQDSMNVKEIVKNEMTTIMCQAGVDEFFIDANGDVFPCALLCDKEYKLFNILLNKNTAVDYFEDSRYQTSCPELMMLEPEKNEKCKDCSISLFCSACPAYLSEYRKDENLLDKWCEYNKSLMENLIWEM